MGITQTLCSFCLSNCMQFITGDNRHQSIFSTLEEQVAAENPVRLTDAFIDKLDLAKMVLLKQYTRAKAADLIFPPCY